jgi:hypothetical protein
MTPTNHILVVEKDDDFRFPLGRVRRELKDNSPVAIDCRGQFHCVQHGIPRISTDKHG